MLQGQTWHHHQSLWRLPCSCSRTKLGHQCTFGAFLPELQIRFVTYSSKVVSLVIDLMHLILSLPSTGCSSMIDPDPWGVRIKVLLLSLQLQQTRIALESKLERAKKRRVELESRREESSKGREDSVRSTYGPGLHRKRSVLCVNSGRILLNPKTY